MASDEVEFYLKNRLQIRQWAAVRKEAERLMRNAVADGSSDAAIGLLVGESGNPAVDFYVRNQSTITEWAALEAPAGLELHNTLLEVARAEGCSVHEGANGWTTVGYPMARFQEVPPGVPEPQVELGWMRKHLLGSGRMYPYPRLALLLHPEHWEESERARLADAARGPAAQLGMKKHENWWVHWGMLAEIPEDSDLASYVDYCFQALRDASTRLYPVLREALTAPGS